MMLRAWLQKLLPPPDLRTPGGYEKARQRLVAGPDDAVFRALNALKAEGTPHENTDYLRALHFRAKGQTTAACEALKEELRYFPLNSAARALLDKLQPVCSSTRPETLGDTEFQELYAQIQPFTMVGQKRLWSLWQLARQTCEEGGSGNFVECGVAAGGASALLATAIQRYSREPRLLYSCDSFAGMPPPTGHDRHHGQGAEATGWGTGTCAAPMESLQTICAQLGVAEIVRPVKGLFCDTLPVRRADFGPIAMLHMDGDWYESTRDILRHLYEQVQPGAPIQVDDFGYWEGCRRALEEYRVEHGLSWELHTIDETGVWMRKPGAAASAA